MNCFNKSFNFFLQYNAFVRVINSYFNYCNRRNSLCFGSYVIPCLYLFSECLELLFAYTPCLQPLCQTLVQHHHFVQYHLIGDFFLSLLVEISMKVTDDWFIPSKVYYVRCNEALQQDKGIDGVTNYPLTEAAHAAPTNYFRHCRLFQVRLCEFHRHIFCVTDALSEQKRF